MQLPENFIRFEASHIKQMAEHAVTMAMRHQGQFGQHVSDVMRGLIGATGLRAMFVA